MSKEIYKRISQLQKNQLINKKFSYKYLKMRVFIKSNSYIANI